MGGHTRTDWLHCTNAGKVVYPERRTRFFSIDRIVVLLFKVVPSTKGDDANYTAVRACLRQLIVFARHWLSPERFALLLHSLFFSHDEAEDIRTEWKAATMQVINYVLSFVEIPAELTGAQGIINYFINVFSSTFYDSVFGADAPSRRSGAQSSPKKSLKPKITQVSKPDTVGPTTVIKE